MKINVNQIPQEGLILREDTPATELDLETKLVKFHRPINIEANIQKITNAVTVDLALSAYPLMYCVRCLGEFETTFKKNIRLNYQVDNLNPLIDLNPQIREEIILDYPISPLCIPNCKGLCLECGKNLNAEKCNCA